VGHWNGHSYTADEFDEAVQAARELKDQYHAPVKIGHDDGQALAQRDGYPAVGWIENLRREGDTLIGDLKAVPARVAQLIKSGAYRGRSAEFWFNTEYGGKARPFMLKALSLLGVDAPAVESLEDMVTLYNTRQVALALDAAAGGVVCTLAGERPYKTEGGTQFHVGDYAYTPDDADPATWKLRTVVTPGGVPDAGQVGRAIAAFGKGFRGQKARIPSTDRAAVKSRLRGAWATANPDKSEDQMPDALKNSRDLVAVLLRLPDVSARGLLAWKFAHPTDARLAAGPSTGDIQSAVLDALAQQYPPALGEDEDAGSEPTQDGPSQNVIDWFLSGSSMSVVVSDQDVDNLWEIPFSYDAGTDTATLGQPVSVKGTYTPFAGGETGEPQPETPDADETQPPAGAGPMPGAGMGAPAAPATAAMSAAERGHVLTGISTELARLARTEPDVPGLRRLSDLARVPVVYRLAEPDVQQAVAGILSALDDTLARLGETTAGKPGMGFIRATLAEVKRKLAGMKFPQAAATVATNSRGGTDMDSRVLARTLGLPETAGEQEILAALGRGHAAPQQAPDTVLALSREVATLKADAEQRRLAGVLDAAQAEGRLTKAMRGELVRLSAQAGPSAVESILSAMPVVVDMAERGKDGDAPQGLPGQLRPGAVAILKRAAPEALERLSDRRTLAQKRDAVLAENQRERLARGRLSG
jgi:hypothetical protein